MDVQDKVAVLTQLLGQHPAYALVIVLLGFMGGTISGFIGSGGAFLMTPGMMNLGIPGIMAVGANITHKFGKAMVGQRKHAQLGHVDRRLGLILVATSLVGVRTAVVVQESLFERLGTNGSDLYVSAFFVATLTVIGGLLLRDALRSVRRKAAGPSGRLLALVQRARVRPLVYLTVANAHVSLPLLAIVGFLTGYMAGTIGVGGFIGVPAMIYLFGVPTVVATGTELFLAMFMGAFGALNYGLEGYVDLRVVTLLFAGSLPGLFVGTVGTRLVRESYIRLVTAVLVLLCVVSRLLAIPDYLRAFGWEQVGPRAAALLTDASAAMLFGSGAVATTLVFYFVLRAYIRQLRVFRFYRPAIADRRFVKRLDETPVY